MIRAGDVIPNGWFFDGSRNIYHDSQGNFFVDGKWYARPDLVAAQPNIPPAPAWTDHARMEYQRLRTPWPRYSEAWQHARAEKWFSRKYAMFGLPVSLFGACWSFALVTGETYFRPFFAAMAFIAAYPFSFWLVYYRHLRGIDRHKAFAFLAISYAATSVGLKVANARPAPVPLGVPNGHGGWLIPPGTPDWASRVVPPR